MKANGTDTDFAELSLRLDIPTGWIDCYSRAQTPSVSIDVGPT